jgi:hypothetical protein
MPIASPAACWASCSCRPHPLMAHAPGRNVRACQLEVSQAVLEASDDAIHVSILSDNPILRVKPADAVEPLEAVVQQLAAAVQRLAGQVEQALPAERTAQPPKRCHEISSSKFVRVVPLFTTLQAAHKYYTQVCLSLPCLYLETLSLPSSQQDTTFAASSLSMCVSKRGALTPLSNCTESHATLCLCYCHCHHCCFHELTVTKNGLSGNFWG